MIERDVRLRQFQQCYWEWHPDQKGERPTLLFAHATGFCGPVWTDIVSAFPDYHAIALDLRGHGRSQGKSVRDWRDFGQDIANFIDWLDVSEVVGIGHSVGGHAIVEGAAISKSKKVTRLFLTDPVIVDPKHYESPPDAQTSDEPHPITRRRRYFDDPAAMFEKFGSRTPFAWFTENSLRAYCEYGLVPRRDGETGFELACTPETEGHIFTTVLSQPRIFDLIASLQVPITVIRANPDADDSVAASVTWPGLATSFPSVREVYKDEWNHFFPMSDPQETAAIIAAELAR